MRDKKGIVKNLVRMITFVLCILVLVLFVTMVLKPKRLTMPYDTTRKERGFYAEPKDSLDIVFVGSSQLFSTIIPDVLWEEYGITSYVYGANEQTFSISYYYIMEVLKYQNPKAIVLETTYCNWGKTPREAVVRINFDYLRWGKAKIEGIINNVDIKEWEYYFFELAKYHSRWSTLKKSDFEIAKSYNESNRYKGWSYFEDGTVLEDYSPEEAILNCTEMEELDETAMKWLDKIIELCAENNVRLILLKTPNGGNITNPIPGGGATPDAFGMPYYNKLAQVAQDKDISFLNMNLIMTGENHNNSVIAKKATSYFGKWITEQIEITDKRNDLNYDVWNHALGAE